MGTKTSRPFGVPVATTDTPVLSYSPSRTAIIISQPKTNFATISFSGPVTGGVGVILRPGVSFVVLKYEDWG
jgi:hypothetical protein